MHQAASHAELRMALRRQVRLPARLRGAGGRAFDILVCDLSLTGCRAEVLFTMHPGRTMWLTLPGLAPIECCVMWRGSQVYGFRFCQPLHPAVLQHLLATMPAA